MSFPEYLLSQGTVERLGWMLVHFLWQGAVVAVLLAAVLRLLPRAGANLRYLIACSAMVMMVVLPAVTMQFIEVAGPAAEAGPPPLTASPDVTPPAPAMVQTVDETPALPEASVPLETADLTTPIPLQERIASAMEPALPYLVAGWLVGILGLSTWHLGGWAQLQRLKRRMVHRVGDNLQQRAATLGVRLGVHRAVTLLESALVEVPTVVGWLRPAILLPASALTGLSPEQLEAILAHELAHVRRYDYFVNVLQTVVEILGFYHPAVWWVSHRIRIERENCCDDLAVRLCGDSVRYARALTCLEEIRHSQAELAVAATGGSLIERISRLLGRPATDDRRLAWLPGLIVLLLIAGIVIPAALVLAASEPPAALPPAAVASDDPQTQPAATDAAEQGASSTEPNIIRVDFVVARVLTDLTVDRETVVMIENILGEPIQPGQSGKTTIGEIINKQIVGQSTGEALIDLLISRGFMKVVASPTLEVVEGQKASIATGQIPDPNATGGETTSGDGADRYNVELTLEETKVFPRADATMLAVKVVISEPPTAKTGERQTEPNHTAPVPVIDAEPHFMAKNGLYTTGPLGVVTKTVNGESKAEAFYLIAKPTVTPAGKADELAASEPNVPRADLRTEAAGEPNAATATRAQVLVKTRIIEAADGMQLDRETAMKTVSILGKPVQSQGRAGKSSRFRLTVGEFLRGHVVQQSLPNETVQALIDLLASKGYMKVLAGPEVVAQDGKESQIKAVSNEHFWMGSSADGSSRSTELQKVEVGTILNVTPHVEDANNIMLNIRVELSHIVPGPRNMIPPAIGRRSVTATVAMRSGRCVTLAGIWEENTPNKAKDSTSVYVIVMPTLITPPERRIQAKTEYVNSDPIYQELAKQIVEVEQELIADGQKFTPDHPAMVQNRALLNGLKSRLAERKESLEKEFDDRRTEQSEARAEYVNSDPVYRELAKQIVKVEQQLIADGQKFTSDNPVIMRHRALLDGLKQQLAQRKENLEKEFEDRATRPLGETQISVRPRSDPNHSQAGEETQVDVGITIATVADEQRLNLDTAIQIEQILGRPIRPQGQDGRPGQSLDLTVGEVFQNHIVGHVLTEDAVQSLTTLLSSRGYLLKMLAAPRVLALDGVEARMWMGNTHAIPGKDPGTFEDLEIGTKISVTPRIGDANAVTLDIAIELTSIEFPPGSGSTDLPIVTRRTNQTSVTTLNDRYFIYLMGKKQASEEGSQYVMVKPTIVESPGAGPSEARAGVQSASVPELPVTAVFTGTDLREALAEISRRARVSITADETVKPQAVTAELVDTSVAESLRQILKGTPYTFKKIGETVNAPRGQARVSMVFQGDELQQVLQDLSYTAGVPILADETVVGPVYADMKDVPLERALEMVLAGTPYIVKKTPDYYLVAAAPRPPGPKDRRIFEEKPDASPSLQSTYLVYRPISLTFTGDDRRQALMDLAATTGISIAVDGRVTGEISANLANVPLETAFRIILAGTPYVVVKKADRYEVVAGASPGGSKAGDDKEEQMAPMDRSDSRAWTIMRQWNCPPLLLGLTQQFAKVLQLSRRDNLVWRQAQDGGTLRLRVDVEGGLPGEVIVGLFKDARWLDEPVAVRRLSGAGLHTLTGLPPGQYQIGAMIGDAPLPLALGVHRTWPEPIEIRQNQTATADVLVSEAFQKWASGWYNEEVAKDYLGQWGDLNKANLLQGQLTGPDGKPIPFGMIEIREHNPGASGIATADQGTNEQGVYRYDGMGWPYRVTALWQEAIPSAFGYRRQRMYLSRVLEGPQRQDFRFEPFPEGTAKVAGRLVDQKGQPVKGFFLRLHMPPFDDLDLSNLTGGYKRQLTYDAPFISDDGRFELGGLPAGRATMDIVPFEIQRYQHERGKDVILEAGNTVNVDVELVGKSVFYGRVLFEDGTPAVITPALWRGAATRVLMPSGGRAQGLTEVGADGYFTVYLGDSETEALALGDSQLVIEVPTDQERRSDRAGEFPYEKLSQDKSRAGAVTVKRPLPTPTLPPELRQGRPLPQGWRLEYQERGGPGGQRMTQVFVQVKSAASDSQVNRTAGDEQFELYGPDGKRVTEFRVRSAFILDKAQQYILIARPDADKAPDGWRITHGPFTLDLSRPGQYTLTIDPATASELSPKSEQDDASASDSAGVAPAAQPADEPFSARLERMLRLSQAAQTSDPARLPDLFEEQPAGSKSYEVRAGLIVGRHPTEFLTGDFYYLPDKDAFYVQHNPIGSSKLTYYGPIAGKPWQVLNVPEMLTWRIEPWGEAVEGVQIRLRAAKHNWRAEEIPAFRWDVRNAGTRQYLETLADRSGVQLEVDGVWYVWPTFLWGGRVATLSAGQSLDDQLVTLSPMWSPAKPDDLQPREGWVVDAAEMQSSLQLAAGRHTIRLAVIVEPSRATMDEAFRVVSPPLDITIAPRGTGQTASWPPGPDLAYAVKGALFSATLALQQLPPPEPPWTKETKEWSAQAEAEWAGAWAKSVLLAQSAGRAAERAAALAENTPLDASARQMADALAALQKALNNNPANTRDQFTAAGKAHSRLIDVFSGESPPTAQPPEAPDSVRLPGDAPDASDRSTTSHLTFEPAQTATVELKVTPTDASRRQTPD
jgi:type II secretory pathway component GspD/PulD (secretin)/beta-lactamase regulating signal transducer with metallopeptidase domain